MRALPLSHGDIREVTHKLKRCGGKSCRTSHRYNFLWQCGKKMNSALPTDSLAAIVLSDSFGVSTETVELLSHRLFRARTSFLAEAASICAFSEDDPRRCRAPNVKNLAYYLQQAFFIFSKLRNNLAGVNPSGSLTFPIDDPAQGGDVVPVYLGECAEAVAETVFDGHFKINRPLEGDEQKLKKRTRGRPRKVIASCTSKDKTRKLPKNRTGGILAAAHPNFGDVFGFLEPLLGGNPASKIQLLPAIAEARPQIACVIHDTARHLEQQVSAGTRNDVGSTMVIWAKIRCFVLDRFHAGSHECGLENRPETSANQKRLFFGKYGENRECIRLVPKLPKRRNCAPGG